MKSNWNTKHVKEVLQKNRSIALAMALGVALGFASGQTVHSMNEHTATKVPVVKSEKAPEKSERRVQEPSTTRSHFFSFSTDPFTEGFFNDDFLKEVGSFEDLPVAFRPSNSSNYFSVPRLETSQSADQVTVRAEVPGIESEDLDVTVTDNSLTIKGERKEDRIKSEAQKQGSLYGSFERSLTLPCRVESDKAEARLRNGVLSIVIPKSRIAQKETNKLTIKTD